MSFAPHHFIYPVHMALCYQGSTAFPVEELLKSQKLRKEMEIASATADLMNMASQASQARRAKRIRPARWVQVGGGGGGGGGDCGCAFNRKPMLCPPLWVVL